MKRKLIEVALPLEAINEASRAEKSPFLRNHPRSIHLWWARRPLAACRAVLFASLVDDPSSNLEEFPTEEDQQRERQRLFALIEELVRWENTNDRRVIERAREEIRRSTNGSPPPVLDPFAGGGSIPLEAQRLGLEAHASDLNPVAVLMTKALIEIPPHFADRRPVNPDERDSRTTWTGAQGLTADVRYYGQWILGEAERRIGNHYPTVALPPEHGAGTAKVIAWIWARTVKSPNPAWGGSMPLIRSFALSTKAGQRAWIEPIVDHTAQTIQYTIRTGTGEPPSGTVERNGARCLASGAPVPLSYIREEGRAGRMGVELVAIVAEGGGRRVYLPPNEAHRRAAEMPPPPDSPNTELPEEALGFRVQGYGITKHRDLFTSRQLLALTTLSDLVTEARAKVRIDSGSDAVSDAVATYLALAVSRLADFSNAFCSWNSRNTNIRQIFSRQAIPMEWDFAETQPLSGGVNISTAIGWVASALEQLPRDPPRASSEQLDAASLVGSGAGPLVSTDPPYYDNIGYADLADFFYIWLRRSMSNVYPDLFSTVLTPKASELVAAPYRLGGDAQAARIHFEDGLRRVFDRVRRAQSREYPTTVFYAFKQTESSDEHGDASTGWEVMLEGLLSSGASVVGTWPMRTEQVKRTRSLNSNALASSIVLVCRPRPEDAPLATRKELIAALRGELPNALRLLQSGNIAPVDLAQAAIGPGMGVFSRYTKVVEADGRAMSVRTALGLINQVLDETLAEQEGDFDGDTRWALAWFEQHSMNDGPYGLAETLSTAKNTSVRGLQEAGVIHSRAGRVRLLERHELPDGWDPASDDRLTVWETTQHLVGSLENGGERAAADLVRRLGGNAENARQLSYRLYGICERKSWASEALAYNALVVAWPELTRLAAAGDGSSGDPEQMEMTGDEA